MFSSISPEWTKFENDVDVISAAELECGQILQQMSEKVRGVEKYLHQLQFVFDYDQSRTASRLQIECVLVHPKGDTYKH